MGYMCIIYLIYTYIYIRYCFNQYYSVGKYVVGTLYTIWNVNLYTKRLCVVVLSYVGIYIFQYIFEKFTVYLIVEHN